MLADIAGYSALMERDETRTFERVRGLREALANPQVTKHGGRVINPMLVDEQIRGGLVQCTLTHNSRSRKLEDLCKICDVLSLQPYVRSVYSFAATSLWAKHIQ